VCNEYNIAYSAEAAQQDVLAVEIVVGTDGVF